LIIYQIAKLDNPQKKSVRTALGKEKGQAVLLALRVIGKAIGRGQLGAGFLSKDEHGLFQQPGRKSSVQNVPVVPNVQSLRSVQLSNV
jgi:hypothetical protein